MVLVPCVSELIGSKSSALVGQHGSYIIALFLVGWAIGAAFFGALADRIGRAKTLTLTILVYALCTGLCATAHTWWEMGFYRFLVGAGIGGEMGIGAVSFDGVLAKEIALACRWLSWLRLWALAICLLPA